MIRRFTCHNFRNVNVDDMELYRINLLIGPNNAGKSNLIKAITFCSDMLEKRTQGNFSSAFLNEIARCGWDHIRSKLADSNDAIDLSWDLDLRSNELVKYDLSFTTGTQLTDNQIVHESLSGIQYGNQYDKPFNYFELHQPVIGEGRFSSTVHKGEKGNSRIKVDVSSQDTILMQFKDVLLSNKKLYSSDSVRVNIASLLQKLEDNFEGFHTYSGSEINSAEVRKPRDPRGMNQYLASDGSNLVNVLNYYQSVNLEWKNLFLSQMKNLMHDLKQMEIVSDYDRLVMKMLYDGGQYDLSDVSEGTIKGLIYNLLINMPLSKPIEFLAIDEPEMSLHPAWQKVLAQWIMMSSNVSQFMISTHSPDFLDQFTDGFRQGTVNVLIMDNYGTNPIRRIEYEKIKDDLGDWTLGDLYRTNDPALGGWPW